MTISNLFVYGTLRRLHGHEMHAVLERNAQYRGEGTVQGQLFNLGNYPGLVLSEDPSDHVIGEVYRLDSSGMDETLHTLDDYEGIGPNDPEPHEYRREIVSVRLTDGSIAKAWVYVLNEVPGGSRRISSGDYLERK